MAVPAKKAAEVAYKEKEAGRNVSKTSLVEGNLFEVNCPAVVFFQILLGYA
jgi:hypothetical protein